MTAMRTKTTTLEQSSGFPSHKARSEYGQRVRRAGFVGSLTLALLLGASWNGGPTAVADRPATADSDADASGSLATDTSREATIARLREDLELLASDELQGRGVGTTGIERAAAFIESRFKDLGLQPGAPDGSYRQTFPIRIDRRAVEDQTRLAIQVGGMATEAERGKDYQPIGLGGNGQGSVPLAFAGYGISAPDLGYDDYADIDVQGKAVLILRREPQQNDADSPFDGKKTSTHSYIQTKLKAAKAAGAAAVLLVNDPTSTSVGQKDRLAEPDAFGSGNQKMPLFHITQKLANEILKRHPLAGMEGAKLEELTLIESAIDADLKPMSQVLDGATVDFGVKFEDVLAPSSNIIGVLEGTGALANETVVFGAHYDHLGFGGYGSLAPGMNQIHNGADDNASGTAVMLELARRFATSSPQTARRMVFIAFTGEERGLLGSEYYTKNPAFPLESTVAMFNYDMLGRMKDQKLTIYGVGTAKEFSDLVDQTANPDAIKLDRIEGTMPNSDHYPFFRKQIPNLHFFTGLHKEYHTPDDVIDTLNFPGMASVVDYSVALISAATAPDAELTWRAVRDSSPTRRGQMAYLGVVPDYSGTEGGLPVSGVKDDSPAAKAGVEEGDRIVKLGDVEITGIENLADALRKYKPGETVSLVVERDGETVTLTIVLGESK